MTVLLREAAERLRSGHGLTFRERLQVERTLFRMTARRVHLDLGQDILSMSRPAFLALCQSYRETLERRPPAMVTRAFDAIELIRALASADPYVVNENIRQFAEEAPTGLAALPSILWELADRAQRDPSLLATD